jgi:hypothetical protein
MAPIPNLRPWLQQPFPAIYDLESATPTEMVAKIHGAMNTLIENYNNFVVDMEKEMQTLSQGSAAEIQDFKQSVEKRIGSQFDELNAQFLKLKADLLEYAAQYLAENVQGVLPPATTADNGKLLQVINGKWTTATPAFTYDPETESLNLIIGEGV